eukprot:7277983-Heterocapsa_arctica.AAC.1
MAGVAAAECQNRLVRCWFHSTIVAETGGILVVAAVSGDGSKGKDDFVGGRRAVVDEVDARLFKE